MPGDYLPDDLKALWSELSTKPVQVSPDQLRRELGRLQEGLRRRGMVGGGVGLTVVAAFLVYLFLFPNTLQRIGSALTVVGVLYLLLQLKMRPARARPHLAEIDCAAFYRAELERQRDFHRGTLFWSRLVVLLPGPLLFFVGFAQTHPERSTYVWGELAGFLVLAAIAVPLNLRLARKYQRRIDALDASVGRKAGKD